MPCHILRVELGLSSIVMICKNVLNENLGL